MADNQPNQTIYEDQRSGALSTVANTPASEIDFEPEGTIESENVQDAITEVAGPLKVVQEAAAAVMLTNEAHVGRMVELIFGGPVTLTVSGLTGVGNGLEVHKLTGGDVSIVGGVGSTTIPSLEGRLVRVRTDGVYVS